MFKERLDALIKEGEGTLSKWHDILEDYSKEIQAERERAVQEFQKQEFSIYADEDSNVPDGLQQKTIIKARWIDGRFVKTKAKGTVFDDVVTAMLGSTPRKTKKEKPPSQVEIISQLPTPQEDYEEFRSVEVPDPAYIIPNRR